MASETSICNVALSLIGKDQILSLTENSNAARHCKLIFAETRDAVLRSHPWNFAIRRVALAETAGSPAFEYANSFQLPANYLRVLRMEDRRMEFKIEGSELLTDESSANIIYITRITDPNQFDAQFSEVLAHRLAMKLAISLTDSGSTRDRIKKDVELLIQEARSIDGQEGTPEGIDADAWIDARV